MKREIKFRVWDHNTNTMMIPDYFEFYDGKIGWIEAGREKGPESGNDGNPDQFEIMQYTGLTDENGVDVYEGDVLQWHTDNLAQKDWTGIVRWLKGAFIVDTGGSYQALIQTEWYQHHSRVVGNIYANPEYTVAEGKEVPLL